MKNDENTVESIFIAVGRIRRWEENENDVKTLIHPKPNIV